MTARSEELLHFFAAADPGLTSFVKQELIELGLEPIEAADDDDPAGGGVTFSGDLRHLYLASLWLRTASRILVRAGEFVVAGFAELRRKTHNLPWEKYLHPEEPIAVRVTSHASKLYVKPSIAREIAVAVADRLGVLPPVMSAEGGRAQLILVRLVRNRCTISVDSSGDHLHRRGYRLATAKAPLRETLAAGMLLASGWDRVSPLLDPFCGSGTIPIEAALLSHHIPPGRNRRFRFQEWSEFNQPLWEKILKAAESQRKHSSTVIQGSDRDAGAISTATENAERAGVKEYLQLSRRAVSHIDPPSGSGWIVTNPPYGRRTSDRKDLRNLYDRFGEVMRLKCPGWQASVLGADEQLLSRLRLRFDPGVSLSNGGISVKLARGKVGKKQGLSSNQ